MSFTRELAKAVIAKGAATSEDVAPEFPDKTMKQITKGLHNARTLGLLELAAPGRNLGRGKGRAPGLYRAKQPEPRLTPAVNSVWSLAA